MIFAAILLLAANAAAAPPWHLTVNGLGPVRIGMSPKQSANALGTKLSGGATESGAVCVEKRADSLPGVTFMFENGRLTRISVHQPSQITTPRGVGAGASADQVRKAYGARLRVENTKYEPPPAEYLTYWTVANKRGVRFETDSNRRVAVMHAGTESIIYVEGCA